MKKTLLILTLLPLLFLFSGCSKVQPVPKDETAGVKVLNGNEVSLFTLTLVEVNIGEKNIKESSGVSITESKI